MTSRQSVNIKTYLSLDIFLKTGGLFWSFKNRTFSKIIPCAKHVLNTFKLRTLTAHLWLFRKMLLFILEIEGFMRFKLEALIV